MKQESRCTRTYSMVSWTSYLLRICHTHCLDDDSEDHVYGYLEPTPQEWTITMSNSANTRPTIDIIISSAKVIPTTGRVKSFRGVTVHVFVVAMIMTSSLKHVALGPQSFY